METQAAGREGKPLLSVERLTVGYRAGSGWREAVRGVSLEVWPGQVYGVVGESGSGKTTLALAIMRYLPREGRVLGGSIHFDGQDLLSLSREDMRRLWGSQMALVPQEPLSSLNPSMTIGQQMAEPLREHRSLSAAEAGREVGKLLEMVRIADPDRVSRSYPHQISGGMQQRVLIAMALSTEPKLLVLDEPTTSLDATTQAAILDLIRDLMRDHETAALYVSHNLGVLAQIAHRVAVLYAGELVEDGPTTDLYYRPLFPYTQGLLDSVPRLGESKTEVRLRPIQGRIPELDEIPSGCVFRPRCPIPIDLCEQRPPLYAPDAERRTRCHRWEEILAGAVNARQPAPLGERLPAPDRNGKAVLEVEGVKMHFPQRRSANDLLTGRRPPSVKALDGVDFTIGRAQTVGLVGESGSGKTTLARAIVGLFERTGGDIRLFGETLPAGLSGREVSLLRQVQIVFQSPQDALNPYLTIGETLRYPFEKLRGLSRKQAQAEVDRLLQAVHLTPEYARRLPSQLSGGEKQRVAVARAIATRPALVIADEPVTSLDVSVQASILNLLNELQSAQEISYLFISHNLAVVGFLADIVAVIYLGRLMEVASARDLFEPPYHPYTESLLSAIPLIDPKAEQERIRLEGEVPNPTDVPTGCPFHPRCPRFLGDICVNEEPPWRTTRSGTRYYCHIPEDELLASQKRAFTFGAEKRT